VIWSLLHDLFATFGMGADLLVRVLKGTSTGEYVSFRLGRRIDSLSPVNVWLHGVSTGEVLALDGVIAELRSQQPAVRIAVSTMTADGLAMIRKFKNAPDLAFIYPIDTSWFAKRIVRRLQPRVLAILDGDFWFQMLRACDRAGVPVIVINGRLSERSVRNYAKFASYSKQMFNAVELASVQSVEMEKRFEHFIAKDRIVVDGNLKLDSRSARLSDTQREALRRELGINPKSLCIVFGSIHPQELPIVSEAARQVLEKHPEVRIVMVPRHPDKFPTRPDIPTSILWINRLGVLRDTYQIADVAFVGGTFCDVGGHNLAEPALLGVATIYGPRVESQVPLHEMLRAYGASRQVATAAELVAAIDALIESADLRNSTAASGKRLAQDSAGLTIRIAKRILLAAGVG
jgi:3-deoxy-D-manno-octulosonic-acid transferase